MLSHPSHIRLEFLKTVPERFPRSLPVFVIGSDRRPAHELHLAGPLGKHPPLLIGIRTNPEYVRVSLRPGQGFGQGFGGHEKDLILFGPVGYGQPYVGEKGSGDQVNLIAGTFLSNVGLAVSDWAKQNTVLFVASEPLTESLTWSQGHPYVFRVRPNTYEQGRMLAERAGKMKFVRWATIGPNYEYGKRAWETFRA